MLVFCHFFAFFSKTKPPLQNMRKWVFRGWQDLSKNVDLSSNGGLRKKRSAKAALLEQLNF
jgi:hypothetical protein